MIHFPAREEMEQLSRTLSPSRLEQTAIPAYLHRNPLVGWIIKRRFKKVVQMLELSGGERVLDFGCGTGILFFYLQSKSIRYTGTDIDLTPARYLLVRHRKEIQLIELERLFGDDFDDLYERIVAIEVLEHVEDPGRLLKHLKQKLTPDGLLVITGPTENPFYRLCRRIAGFSGTYHRRNIDNVIQIAEASGLVPRHSVVIPIPGPCALFKLVAFENPYSLDEESSR